VLFNSFTFLVFFALVLLLHRLPLPWWVKKLNLLLASLLFYAAWNPPYVALLWISILTDFYAARAMDRSATNGRRRLWLLVSLTVNLGLLGYFKYAAFALDNFVWLLAQAGLTWSPAPPDIILPLGISFYTFQTLSYTITIYRRQAAPTDSLLDFALFVTFFPQLVAGPIVRATDFLSQLETPRQADARQFGWGLWLMSFGIFEKVVLADAFLAPLSDRVFARPAAAGTIDAWMGCLAFGGQIFFDFAGYSLCAIGAGLCLGFVLPRNFSTPYASLGFTDFWRRWHITLSTWLRDYVYFSLLFLFRNRRNAWTVSGCLALTMLLGGLWHGAAWQFVIWGGLHGLYLMLDRALRPLIASMPILRTALLVLLGRLITFGMITLTWVFFRPDGLDACLLLLSRMFGTVPGAVLDTAQRGEILAIVGAMVAVHLTFRDVDLEERFSRLPAWVVVPILALPILCLFFVPGDQRAFIYFQF